MTAELWLFLGALIGAGLFAGFIGGLFGVGGGVVIVPALFHVFAALGVPESVRVHAAVATSLSIIIATSWRSLATHAQAGAVDFAVLKAWVPWVATGAALGGLAAGFASGAALLAIFGIGLVAIAANMAFGRESWKLAADLPAGRARAALGVGLGGLSALMGIGGGVFGVTLMTLCGRPIHQAVATASGFGATIAVPACAAYMIVGWGQAGLPPGSIGYVNAPGFALLAAITTLTAPMGARLAHRLDRLLLKRLFAAFLSVTATNILLEAFT